MHDDRKFLNKLEEHKEDLRKINVEFSVTFVDKDGFYNHKLVVANNVDEVQKYMEDFGYTDIKIEKR